MPKFIIHGGKKLHGEVTVSGSKNAALPILAATLLRSQPCVIKNVPDIEDIHTMLAMLRALGTSVEFRNHTVFIQTKNITYNKIPQELGCKMRASVLLLGPLLSRMGYAKLPYPGGCVLGARPIDTHVNVLSQFGIRKKKSHISEVIFEGFPKAAHVILPEFSVTATENAIMAAALSKGKTTIHLAAVEPHVQDLCRFLQKLGVEISGIGTHTVLIHGRKKPQGRDISRPCLHTITPDYLEVGTFAVASILTNGTVTISNIAPHDLDAFWNLLQEMGVKFELTSNAVTIKSTKTWNACNRLQTNVFPGFPTDLQPPFTVLLTQADGRSRIHETLFEGRFNYFPELIKMGARIKKLNPHEAIIDGPTKLRGTSVKSWDIRAGAAMILAGLVAKGKTIVTDIHYIDRGYEELDEKLRKLGARIERIA